MKKKTNKHLIIIVEVLIISFIAGEIYLRQVWGFCDSVLIQTDPDFEYIAQPNQNRFRFKKHIIYNEFSQRNNPVDSSAYIVLGLGDSVINGGVLTEQDSLATSRLSRELTTSMQRKVQVLNISAGSWGPDNCMAYLERYGTFGASLAFLVCSSHDTYDVMDFTPIVDKDPSFLSKQYPSAWQELIDRYVLPRLKVYIKSLFSSHKEEYYTQIHKSGKIFNPGFIKLATYFKEQQIPFVIYLHAEKSEQKIGQYNGEGKKIVSFCQENGILIMTDLGILMDADYRDNIHLSEQGQYRLFEELKMFLSSFYVVLN